MEDCTSMVILQPAAPRLGGFRGLATWMRLARVMRVGCGCCGESGVWRLIVGGKDESWKDFWHARA